MRKELDRMSLNPAGAKRIPREITNAKGESLTQHHIQYEVAEENLQHGFAMILGPADTPQAWCPLLFEIRLPNDYPFSSPSVKFLTTDGSSRFHPNLYREGKVCLSILGTFTGPSWASTMNLSTVLLSIQSLLDNNPLRNEPGFEKTTLADGSAGRKFRDIVEYRMAAHTYRELKRFEAGAKDHLWNRFRPVLEPLLPKIREHLTTLIFKKEVEDECHQDSVSYGMNGKTFWKVLAAEVRGAHA